MQLDVYKGSLEGELGGDDAEVLRDLMTVIEATQEKTIRLTKAGLPPKPLWSSVNEKMLWSDPASILYDWDECDQVRFVYSMATMLSLVQATPDRQLVVGPGADLFFLASPSRRAALLMKAYLDVAEWDERCDARNEYGHRQNFGQTFRRDFLRDSKYLRQSLFDALEGAPVGEWVEATTLAKRVTHTRPDILISEDDEHPDTPKNEADPEIGRLVSYWVFLAARFGWVDIARTPEVAMKDGGDRLFRLTEKGKRLIGGDVAGAEASEIKRITASRPFVVQPNHDVVIYREEGDLADEYLLRRIADPNEYPSWDEPVATYKVTAESVQSALQTGVDPDLIEERLVGRAKHEVPKTFTIMFEDAARRADKVRLTQGLTAVEMPPGDLLTKVKKAGFPVYDDIVLVGWDKWHVFSELVGEEPTEGFRYPPEEPLASFVGDELQLEWPALPMIARDILDACDLAGDPLSVTIDDAQLALLGRAGFSERAVAESLYTLVGLQRMPKRLQSQVIPRDA